MRRRIAVPKSKVRKKTADAASAGPLRPGTGAKPIKPSAPWYPAVMASMLVLGLAYIVVYYMAAEQIPFMNDLGSWNFAIGFGFLIGGLGMAVRWR
jgi:hypothetical protein